MKVTQLEIYRGQLERNRGHNEKAHGYLAFSQTGYTRHCYRCQLLKKIEKEELPKKRLERTWST